MARSDEAQLAAVAEHEVVRPGLGPRAVDRDLPADQARLDPAGDVGDGRALEHDRVLDLAAPDDRVVAHGRERSDIRVLDHRPLPDDGVVGFSTRRTTRPPASSATPNCCGFGTRARRIWAFGAVARNSSTSDVSPARSRLSPRYMTNGSPPTKASAIRTAWASPSGASCLM